MQLFINNWASRLSSTLPAASLDMQIPAEDAARLVGLGSGGYYLLTLIAVDGAGGETAHEIVRVTGVAGSVLTIERAQEETTATDWQISTPVEARFTAAAAAAPAAALAAHASDPNPHPEYAPPVHSVNGRTGVVSVLELPPAGASGQVLAKASAADGDTAWIDPPAGGGGGGGYGAWQIRYGAHPMTVGVTNNTAITSVTLGSGTLRAHPFRVAEEVTIRRVGVRNNTIGGDVIARAGIYSNNPTTNFEWPALLLFGGTYTAKAAGGFFGYPDTLDGETITLQPGVTYWAVYGATTTSFGAAGVAVAGQENAMGIDPSSNQQLTELYHSDSSGGMPADLSGVTTGWMEAQNLSRVRFLLERAT